MGTRPGSATNGMIPEMCNHDMRYSRISRGDKTVLLVENTVMNSAHVAPVGSATFYADLRSRLDDRQACPVCFYLPVRESINATETCHALETKALILLQSHYDTA